MPPDESHTVESAYDRLSQSYKTRENDPYCADLEFPAMTELIPTVEDKRILDAGCGTGRYAEWLIERGATVVGVDRSSEMVREARRRTDGNAEIRRADLGQPLEFADDGEFDGVVSGLALQYLEDWRPAFAEFARILRPGGFLVFSTHHPVDDYIAFEAGNYFETEQVRMTWSAPDGDVDVPFYRRPFAEVVTPLLEAGFRLEELVEPTPTEAFEEEKPESYEKRLTYPTFICVRAVNPR